MKTFFTNFRIPILGFLIIVSIWALSFFAIKSMTFSIENMGLVGDTFGSINSLFSGLAFAGLIYTIYLQRKDLELSKEELKLTREELRRTAQAQIDSQRALVEQVEEMRRATRSNAITCMVNYHSTLAGAYASNDHHVARNQEIEKANSYAMMLQAEIRRYNA